MFLDITDPTGRARRSRTSSNTGSTSWVLYHGRMVWWFRIVLYDVHMIVILMMDSYGYIATVCVVIDTRQLKCILFNSIKFDFMICHTDFEIQNMCLMMSNV